MVDDAPAKLKQTLQGVLLEIKTDQPLLLKKYMQEQHAPAQDLYPYGTALHVLAAPSDLPAFAAYNPEQIRPTLEDVFVYYLRQFRGEEQA